MRLSARNKAIRNRCKAPEKLIQMFFSICITANLIACNPQENSTTETTQTTEASSNQKLNIQDEITQIVNNNSLIIETNYHLKENTYLETQQQTLINFEGSGLDTKMTSTVTVTKTKSEETEVEKSWVYLRDIKIGTKSSETPTLLFLFCDESGSCANKILPQEDTGYALTLVLDTSETQTLVMSKFENLITYFK